MQGNYSRQRSSFSAHRAALMTKSDLTLPAFSLRFVDFAVQFCFRCRFPILFQEKTFRFKSDRDVTFWHHK